MGKDNSNERRHLVKKYKKLRNEADAKSIRKGVGFAIAAMIAVHFFNDASQYTFDDYFLYIDKALGLTSTGIAIDSFLKMIVAICERTIYTFEIGKLREKLKSAEKDSEMQLYAGEQGKDKKRR